MSLKEFINKISKPKTLKLPKPELDNVRYLSEATPEGDAANGCVTVDYDEELTIYKKTEDFDGQQDKRGVIIVLKSIINRVKIGNQNIVDFLNDHLDVILNHYGLKATWAMGYYMNGEYIDDHGILFDGDSICIEFQHLGENELIGFAQIFCDSLNQYGVIVKVNSDNSIFYLPTTEDLEQ